MKIALCLEYPIGLRGGVSILVETLLRGFTQRGHQVLLVSPDTPNSLRESKIGEFVWRHIQWLPQHHPSIAKAKNLARQLAEAGVDIAHFHAGGNYGWGNRFPYHSPIHFLQRLGVPCVSTVHSITSIFTGYCGDLKPLWFKALLLPLGWLGKMQHLHDVCREIAVSQHDYQKLQCWYRPFRHRFVQIYHSRIETEKKSAALSGSPGVSPALTGLADEASALPTRERLILNVGHIARRKGQLILAQAFARIAPRHPDWKLAFAGHSFPDGIAEEIQQIATMNRLGDRIQLLGQRNDAMELMRRAAIYVQPSLEEALGLALQEAMYCACPSIGSRVGGIPELIENGQTGILVEAGNIAALSEALEKLMKDKSLRIEIGRAAAGSILRRGMTVSGMVDRHLELYDQIINRK
jgi:glycosyltransferase involved in cell wall biosynthesis